MDFPVDLPVLLAFSAASLALLVIPGPTIIMVVAQALAHGRRVALASVAGVALGDLLAASLSLVGVGTILAASATAFTVIKWAGAAYLVWIGVKMVDTPDPANSSPTAFGVSSATINEPESPPALMLVVNTCPVKRAVLLPSRVA